MLWWLGNDVVGNVITLGSVYVAEVVNKLLRLLKNLAFKFSLHRMMMNEASKFNTHNEFAIRFALRRSAAPNCWRCTDMIPFRFGQF